MSRNRQDLICLLIGSLWRHGQEKDRLLGRKPVRKLLPQSRLEAGGWTWVVGWAGSRGQTLVIFGKWGL